MAGNESFKCVGDNLEEIPESIVDSTGLEFPKVHTKAEYMKTLSKELRKYKNNTLCTLPFCNTVEAEVLGANIKLGNAKTGPRVESYIFSSIDELKELSEIDLTKGRIREVLNAVEDLNAEGELVSLNVEGPFTIIASLIDSMVFYRAIRKEREAVDEFIKVIEDGIVKYIKEGIKRGAKIISYGDPVGAMDIVGPKVYKDVSAKSTYNILKRVEGELNGAIIHLCGKTSTAFESIGFAEAQPIKFEEQLTYGQAINYVLKERKDIKFLGHNCIKRTPFKLKDSTLWVINLK